MTAAICLKCGRMKVGAWTPCPACRHWPESREDRARHMLATDHYLDRQSLQALSQVVKKGQDPSFPQEVVREIAESLPEQTNDPAALDRFFRVARIGKAILGTVVIALITFLLWAKFKH